MTFLNNIFKLYYHELKLSKKIFLLLSAAILTWLIFTIVTIFYNKYMNTGFYIFKGIHPIILKKAADNIELNLLNQVLLHTISFKNLIPSNILMFVPICILSILGSYIIVSRDFKKKNSSYYIIYNLPYKSIEIKISKILVGLSIYIYTITVINLSLILIDLLNKYNFGNLYMNGIWSITSEVRFLAFNYTDTIFFTFGLVLPSIIGLQSAASLIYTSSAKNRLVKKIILFILILASAFFVLYIGIDMNFNGLVRVYEGISISSILLNYIFIISLYILILVLFILDLIHTSKSFRGGLNYEDR
nr:hypothetical protein [uncultured Peptostreptococcus sp.]